MFGWLKSIFGSSENSPVVSVTPVQEVKEVKKSSVKKAPAKKKAPVKKAVAKKKVAPVTEPVVVSDELPVDGVVAPKKRAGRPKKNS